MIEEQRGAATPNGAMSASTMKASRPPPTGVSGSRVVVSQLAARAGHGFAAGDAQPSSDGLPLVGLLNPVQIKLAGMVSLAQPGPRTMMH